MLIGTNLLKSVLVCFVQLRLFFLLLFLGRYLIFENIIWDKISSYIAKDSYHRAVIILLYFIVFTAAIFIEIKNRFSYKIF